LDSYNIQIDNIIDDDDSNSMIQNTKRTYSMKNKIFIIVIYMVISVR
jgi:hypothetical protein